MPETENHPLNIICLATYFKGAEFIRECKAHGCRVILVTKEKVLDEDWPRESLDDLIAVPNDAGPALFIDLLAFLGRKMKIDRVVALEVFRDKLSMAVHCRRAGIDVPDFVPLVNVEEVDEFMQRVPGPWVIKPRSD